MNKVELTDDQLTYLHHIIGYSQTFALLEFARNNIRSTKTLQELEKININVEFVDNLYNSLDASYDNMPTQKYLNEWKDAVKYDKTTLSLEEYCLTKK